MGGKTVTQQNLRVMKIDTVDNLVYVKGAVPGVDDAYVRVSDSIKKNWFNKCFPAGASVPFPTFVGKCEERELVPSQVPTILDPMRRAKRERD
jgi:large subunit ribosomal protein L3